MNQHYYVLDDDDNNLAKCMKCGKVIVLEPIREIFPGTYGALEKITVLDRQK